MLISSVNLDQLGSFTFYYILTVSNGDSNTINFSKSDSKYFISSVPSLTAPLSPPQPFFWDALRDIP